MNDMTKTGTSNVPLFRRFEMNTAVPAQEAFSGIGVARKEDAPSLLHRALRTDPMAAPALLRLTLAVVMFPHGAQHLFGWFGGYGFAGTHSWMTGELGIPAAIATLAILTEFFAPLALLVGLGGRMAAFAMAGFMVGAASTHLEHGFFMNWSGALPAGAEGFEFHILVIAMALAVAVQGSGAWSVDRLLARRR
jgi:putative oxidoreductase